jgi:hypothetical protein
VAGTIYEAIHHAVFSNFLLLSAIRVLRSGQQFPNPVYSVFSISQTK